MLHWFTDEKEKFVCKSETADAPATGELCVSDTEIAPVEGFGGCFNELGYRAISALNEEERAAVMEELFGACKFRFCRLPVGANDFALGWYSYDETAEDYELHDFSVEHDEQTLLPYVREALKRQKDLRLFASPWSPPSWMKTNGQYNSGRLRPEERVIRAYAEYFCRYLAEYKKRGVHIDILCPQNEVMADTHYPSCLYTGKEFQTLISAVSDAIRAKGLKTQVWLGTINSDSFEDYAFRMLEDGQLREKIGGVGYQWLGKEAIQKTHEAFPAVPLIQTESECGDGENTFAYAEYIFSLMQHYMNNGARAYVYWNMILGKDPHSSWGWAQNSLITVDEDAKTWKKNPEFYLMKHFSAFVGKGDRSVKCTGNWCANAVAFQRADGSRVAVLHNPLDEERVVSVRSKDGEHRIALRPHSFNTVVF